MLLATLNLHRDTAQRDSQSIRTKSSTDLPKGTEFIWIKEWANLCPAIVQNNEDLGGDHLVVVFLG